MVLQVFQSDMSFYCSEPWFLNVFPSIISCKSNCSATKRFAQCLVDILLAKDVSTSLRLDPALILIIEILERFSHCISGHSESVRLLNLLLNPCGLIWQILSRFITACGQEYFLSLVREPIEYLALSSLSRLFSS